MIKEIISPSADNRFVMQASQYEFPYHYIADGSPPLYRDLVQIRSLDWGAEYLSVLDTVASHVIDRSVENVLDAGCGDGRLVGRLRRCGFQHSYYGVDLVKSAIDFAKAFNPSENFECQSLEEIDNLFDCVTLIEVLEHIPDEEVSQFMGNLVQKIKPGGILILTVPSDVRPVHKKHFRHYNKKLVIDTLCACGLEVEKIEGVYKEDFWIKLLLKLRSNGIFTVSNRRIQTLISTLVYRRQTSLTEAQSTHWCIIGKKC